MKWASRNWSVGKTMNHTSSIEEFHLAANELSRAKLKSARFRPSIDPRKSRLEKLADFSRIRARL